MKSEQRQRLTAVYRRALAALHHPDLPPEIKALYKRALDKADLALGLDHARMRRQALADLAPTVSRPDQT